MIQIIREPGPDLDEDLPDPARVPAPGAPLVCVKPGPCPCPDPCRHVVALASDLPQAERARTILDGLQGSLGAMSPS